MDALRSSGDYARRVAAPSLGSAAILRALGRLELSAEDATKLLERVNLSEPDESVRLQATKIYLSARHSHLELMMPNCKSHAIEDVPLALQAARPPCAGAYRNECAGSHQDETGLSKWRLETLYLVEIRRLRTAKVILCHLT